MVLILSGSLLAFRRLSIQGKYSKKDATLQEAETTATALEATATPSTIVEWCTNNTHLPPAVPESS